MQHGLSMYSSSAGSGKTFTLVFSYLRIVVRNPHHYRNTLAVTFTNKATEEMKTRIIAELTKLAAGKKTLYFTELEKYFSLNQLEIDIETNASRALNLILTDYSSFSVCTIESFCQRIIRSFAKELNLPLGYEIEMQSRVVLDKITDDLLLDAGTNEQLTGLLSRFIESRISSQKDWKIDKEIKDLAEELFKERYQKFAEFHEMEENYMEQIKELADFVQVAQESFETKMETYCAQGLDIMEQNGVEIEAFFGGRRSSVPKLFYKIADGNIEEKDFSRLEEASVNIDKWVKIADRDWLSPIAVQMQRVARDMTDVYEKEGKAYFTALEVGKTIHTFGLLNELRNKLTIYRKENRMMMISDTNFLLQNIVKGSEDVPFLYEKIGNQYFYYLIDEFQDTSELQWKNLFPLIWNALSCTPGDDNMLVGDVKQSIYRWRGGELKLMLNTVQEDVGKYHEVLPRTLKNNWRTAKSIVDFNNHLFELAAERLATNLDPFYQEMFKKAYSDVSQHAQKSAVPGLVSVSFVEKIGGKSSWKEDAKRKTVEILAQISKDGFPLSKVLILVRTRKDGNEIVAFLQRNNVKITSSESLLLDSHPTVKMLVALLYYLVDERDTLAKATAGYYFDQLNKPENTETERNAEQILSLFHSQKFELPETFEQQRKRLLRLPLYDCVETLLRLSPELLKPNAYLQGFLDTVLEYNGKNDGGISGFLEWWETLKEKRCVNVAASDDAVQIMTIHKAKGLEFPIIIMPFCDWSIAPKVNSVFWVETATLQEMKENIGEERLPAPYSNFPFYPLKYVNSLERTHYRLAQQQEDIDTKLDNLNLLYVALTRPQYRLYLITPANEKSIEKEGRETKVGDLLYGLITTNQGLLYTQVEAGTYTMGEAISYKETLRLDHKEEKEADNMHESVIVQPVEDWRNIIRVRTLGNQVFRSIKNDQDEKIQTGIMLHLALSKVRLPQDIGNALQALQHNGTLTSQQIPAISAKLKTIVTHPIAANWFSSQWEIRNEAEILCADGESYRPDRILIGTHETLIIDYKTGLVNAKYAEQVQAYMLRMSEMGYPNVKGFLYYITEGQVVEV